MSGRVAGHVVRPIKSLTLLRMRENGRPAPNCVSAPLPTGQPTETRLAAGRQLFADSITYRAGQLVRFCPDTCPGTPNRTKTPASLEAVLSGVLCRSPLNEELRFL